VADVIVGDARGKPRRDFSGRLSFSWPKTAAQFTQNKGKPGYDPLFALGYGLSYARAGRVPALSEEAGIDRTADSTVFFARGAAPVPWTLAADAQLTRRAVDGPQTQEGAQQIGWSGPGKLRITGGDLDLSRETASELALQISYRLDQMPAGPVKLTMDSRRTRGSIDATSLFTGPVGIWRNAKIQLKCYQRAGVDMARVTAPLVIEASAPLRVSIADVRIVSDPNNSICPAEKP
jgi:beta-glucosidase